MTSTTRNGGTTVSNDKHRKFEAGTRVYLTEPRRFGHMAGSDWILDGVLDAGTEVDLLDVTNAGFRGLEWSAMMDDGRVVYGVSVTTIEVA